jgi:DNA (cytosine-5)-methyltransferase 1
MNYYNENNPHAAQWLRNLISAGMVPDGHVDERSIADVQPSDLRGFTQCHFFAGIGGWSEALRLAGWGADRPVWTGSCPCQPLSCAGQRKGHEDDRHLWPEFYSLIRECNPATVFGEQVASNDGLEWIDGVSLDLENAGYAVAAADLPSACVAAPHRRQRLFWVADAGFSTGKWNTGIFFETKDGLGGQGEPDGNCVDGLEPCGADGDGGPERVDNTIQPRREGRRRDGADRDKSGRNGATPSRPIAEASGNGGPERVADRQGDGSEGAGPAGPEATMRRRPSDGGIKDFWSDFQIVRCVEPNKDGGTTEKFRRVESGLEPLVDGIPFRLADGRAGKRQVRGKILEGIGNAIVPQVAAVFIGAYMEVIF